MPVFPGQARECPSTQRVFPHSAALVYPFVKLLVATAPGGEQQAALSEATVAVEMSAALWEDWGDTKSSLLPAPRICEPLQMLGSPLPRRRTVASAPTTLSAPASLVLSPLLKPAASFLPSCCSSTVVRIRKTNKMHLHVRAFVVVIWISLC